MKEFKFDSRSSSAVYTVKLTDSGQTSCDCRGWIYSGVDRHCRHTDEVLGITRTKTPKGSKKAAAKKTKKKVQKTKKSAVDALKGLPVEGISVPYYSPMLAQEGKPDLVEERFASDDWVAEEKYDGARYLMYITEKVIHELKFNRFFSRRISSKNGGPVEKSACIPHLSDYDLSEWAGTVLDGEIIPSSGVFTDTTKIMGSLPEVAILKQKQLGKVIYRVFDILFYKGTSLMDEPLNVRLSYLRNVPFNKYMHQVKQTFGESKKRKLYSDIISRGGEGIILKHSQSLYRPGIRDKNIWMKVKRKRDFDVVVMGFEDPKQYSVNVDGDTVENKHWLKKQIATIKFGVFKGGQLVEVGKCGGLDDAMREEISRNKKRYLNKVMVVEGQEFLKTSIRFPHFIRFREDKAPTDCKYEDLLT